MLWDILPPLGIKIAVIAGIILIFFSLLRMLREKRNAPVKRQLVAVILRLVVIAVLVTIFLNPIIISPKDEEGKQKLIVLLDRSASMATRDVENSSRFEAALSTLRDPKILEALKSEFILDTRVFEKDIVEMKLEKLTPADATGVETDIKNALIHAVEDLHAASAKAGVLLISDGRSTLGDPHEASQLALARSIPIWTWCPGGNVAHRDVWLQTPSSEILVFGGDEIEMPVTIHQEGYADRSFKVDLLKENVVLDSKEVVADPVKTPGVWQTPGVSGVPDSKEILPGQDNAVKTPGVSQTPGVSGQSTSARVSFHLTAPESGEHRYVFRIDPQDGEADTRNNERAVFLKVVGEKVRVLLIEGQPHWDTKFLVQTLKQHKRVDLTAIYRLGPQKYSAIVSQQGKFRREETNLFPNTVDELFGYDICIFGRDCETFFTDETEDMLTDFVAERGGGLIFSRGKPYSGRFYPLAKLEPVVWGSGVEENVTMKITNEGLTNSIFEIGSGPESDINELFDRMPRLDLAMATEGEKPLAIVLAASDTEQNEVNNILMAFQRYGQGKVVTLNTTGIWRWAFREETTEEEEYLYNRFWMSLLRWLLSDTDFLPGADVSLRSERRYYTDKQQIQFQVMTRGINLDSYKPRLTISGNEVTEELEPAKGRGGWYTVSAGPFQPGTYNVVLYNNVGQPPELKTQVEVVSSSLEKQNLSADPETMKKIAEHTDGQVLSQSDIANLPKIVRDWQIQRELSTKKASLWDRWWILLAIIVVLGLELYLRRQEGLL